VAQCDILRHPRPVHCSRRLFEYRRRCATSKAPADCSACGRTGSVCDSCSIHSYSYSRCVVRLATVMPGGRRVWSFAMRRAEMSAMRERYSKPVGSVGAHSGCASLNDMDDFSSLRPWTSDQLCVRYHRRRTKMCMHT